MKAAAIIFLLMSLFGGLLASFSESTTYYEDAILLALLAIGAGVIAYRSI